MLRDLFHTNHQAVYIAEIGLNHNGDLSMALQMIEAAAQAGADAVKFQTYVPELMNSVHTTRLLMDEREGAFDTAQIDFLRRFTLRKEEYRELQRAAEKRGLVFFSSVFDGPSLDLLEEIGVPLYKLASSEITSHPLIERIALTGKPLILSTGMTNEEEIGRAVDLFRRGSDAELALLHCVSLYPLVPEQANLNRIATIQRLFSLPVGLSDHSAGILAPVLAAGLGARIFEKHFTIDRNYDCPDKDVSITPTEFGAMIEAVESALRMLGSGAVAYDYEEAKTARAARRSLFAARAIPAGKIIEAADLVALRPGVGIPASEMDGVIGARCAVDIPKDYLIRKEYLQA